VQTRGNLKTRAKLGAVFALYTVDMCCMYWGGCRLYSKVYILARFTVWQGIYGYIWVYYTRLAVVRMLSSCSLHVIQ
jgi:hypothetical protein